MNTYMNACNVVAIQACVCIYICMLLHPEKAIVTMVSDKGVGDRVVVRVQ